MTLTDTEVIKAFEKSGLYWLMDRVEDATEEDATDAQIALDVVQYHLYWYSEKDTDEWMWLHSARKLLRETDDGRVIPIDPENGFRPRAGYTPEDIQRARDRIAQYNSMKKLEKALQRIYLKEEEQK